MGDFNVSTNFSKRELACKCGCGALPTSRAIVQLQAVRDIVRRPIIVTSGARCAAHNREIGGAPGSKHLTGIAFDITFPVGDPIDLDIIKAAMNCGFNGIGIGKTKLHIDLRPHSERAMWVYV